MDNNTIKMYDDDFDLENAWGDTELTFPEEKTKSSNEVIVDREAAINQAVELRKKVNELKDELYSQKEVEEELSGDFLELTGKQKQVIIDDIFRDESEIWTSLGLPEIIKRFESLGMPNSFELLPTETRLNGYIFEADAFTVRKVLRIALINAQKASEEEIKDDLFLKIHNNKLAISQKEMYMIVNSILEGIKYGGKIVIPNFERIEFRNYDDENKKIVREKDILTPLIDYSEAMQLPMREFATFKLGGGDGLVFNQNKPDEVIRNADHLHSEFCSNGYLPNFMRSGITLGKILEYYKSNNTNSYERVSLTQELNMKDDTFFIGETIEPESNGYFRDFLDSLTFKDLKSRYRFAAILLSSFQNSDFDAQKPGAGIVADSYSSGKTTVVEEGVNIITGQMPLKFNGRGKDDEELSGILAFGNKNILFDNLQDASKEQLLSITTLITSRKIKSWIMHKSHSTIKNNTTVWLTFNKSEHINNDVLQRLLIIEMADSRDIDDETKLEVSKRLQFFKKNRKKVVADILYLLSLPPVDVEYESGPKTQLWCEEIAGHLGNLFPEVESFDFSLSEEDEELSSEIGLINGFMEDILGNRQTKFLSKDRATEKYREFFRKPAASKPYATRQINNMKKSLRKYRIEDTRDTVDGKQIRVFRFTNVRPTEDEIEMFKKYSYS